MGQDVCIRKDEKPLGYDWECGHEELYVRVNMYYDGSLYVGLWQKQEECKEKLELFGDLTIGVMGFLRPGQAIISDCGAKAKVAFIEKYKLGKVIGKRKINYGSYYVVEFNLARLAQLDPEGTERYKNCSLEESFTHFMTRKRKKMLSNPEFEYHGTVYPSLKVCCEELGINKSSVISRSHRAGCSLQEAVEYYVSQQERRTLD